MADPRSPASRSRFHDPGSGPGRRAIDANGVRKKRQQAVKNAFRKQIGYVDPEEVRRIAKNIDPGDSDLGDVAADAADRARKKEQDPRNQN